jgi:hypothetical protein
LSDCNSLASGSCGLKDSSSAGDWRLPNFNELRSLIDPSGETNPALPNGHPFTGVQGSSDYWSSTTHQAASENWAWIVDMSDGAVDIGPRSKNDYVWPVRGGD